MGFLVIYKGDASGSVQIPDSDFEGITPAPRVYLCPICDLSFESLELLQDHKIASHPLKRPYLLIHGSAVSSDTIYLKQQLFRKDLGIENAENVALDDVSYGNPNEMLDALVANQSGRRVVKLSYQTYQVTISLIFDLISDESLVLVEQCFQEVFSGQELSSFKLRQFDSKLQEIKCANIYAGGLGCYVSGVMAKDRVRSSGLRFEEFNTKFGEALDALDHIDTELSKSIKAAILFSRNQFTRSMKASFLPQLSAVSKFMITGTFHDIDIDSYSDSTLLPIDSVTETLVMFCTKGESFRRFSIESLKKLIKTSSISLDDQHKVNFALMCHFLEISEYDKANEYFRKVKHSSTFKEVAAEKVGLFDDRKK